MEKKLRVSLYEDANDYMVERQEISCDEVPEVSYYVQNLCECPEDAIIGRDLFNANEYIKTLRLGMKLSRLGYTDIELCYEDKK